MSVVPIRPDLPIGITSDAMLFCADAIADFICSTGSDPTGVVIFLYGSEVPQVHITRGTTRGDIALASLSLGKCALEIPTEDEE